MRLEVARKKVWERLRRGERDTATKLAGRRKSE
jgi:hypothetical protein